MIRVKPPEIFCWCKKDLTIQGLDYATIIGVSLEWKESHVNWCIYLTVMPESVRDVFPLCQLTFQCPVRNQTHPKDPSQIPALRHSHSLDHVLTDYNESGTLWGI